MLLHEQGPYVHKEVQENMAKINGNYEVVYILDPALGEEAIAAMVAKFKTMAEARGTVAEVDEWGQAPSGLSHQRPERGLLCAHDLYG